MTFQAIGRGVRRVPGDGLEVKVEIMDAVTQKTVKFEVYQGATLADITAQIQKDLDVMTSSQEDQALSKAVVGVLLAASVLTVDAVAAAADVAPAPEPVVEGKL